MQKVKGLLGSNMVREVEEPYLFEVSWEVANKGNDSELVHRINI